MKLKKEKKKKKFADGDHRIVFGTTKQKDFYDDIKTDQIDNVRIVIFENNEFSIKHLLEVEDKI